MKRGRTTITDIARRAGVTVGVVSVVLNGKENGAIRVGADKKKKILKLIASSNYVPSKSARALVTQRTNTIGIIFHKLSPFFSEFVSHLQQKAFQQHLEIMPYITNADPRMEEHYLRQSTDGRVDGVIAIAHTSGSAERYRRFSRPPYNLKIVSYGPPSRTVPTFSFDKKEAGELAYKHLRETGCRKPAYLGVVENEPRSDSFLAAAASDGYEPTSFTVKGRGAASFPEARQIAREFFDSAKSPPDGIFCFNDLLALGVMWEAQCRGLRIPDDVAVIGCDNTEICLAANPTLTSIDSNIPLMTDTAIRLMESLIRGIPPEPLHTEIPVKLIERDSTKTRRRP